MAEEISVHKKSILGEVGDHVYDVEGIRCQGCIGSKDGSTEVRDNGFLESLRHW